MADQLPSFRAAELRLCFRICKKAFLMTRLMYINELVKFFNPSSLKLMLCRVAAIKVSTYKLIGHAKNLPIQNLFIFIATSNC